MAVLSRFPGGNLLGTAVIAPVSAIAFALFTDLRVRRAFDLQVMMQRSARIPPAPAGRRALHA